MTHMRTAPDNGRRLTIVTVASLLQGDDRLVTIALLLRLPRLPLLPLQVPWSQMATVVAHLFMGSLLFIRARATDLTSSKAIYKCYM